jgi:hypothetical protein
MCRKEFVTRFAALQFEQSNEREERNLLQLPGHRSTPQTARPLQRVLIVFHGDVCLGKNGESKSDNAANIFLPGPYRLIGPMSCRAISKPTPTLTLAKHNPASPAEIDLQPETLPVHLPAADRAISPLSAPLHPCLHSATRHGASFRDGYHNPR